MMELTSHKQYPIALVLNEAYFKPALCLIKSILDHTKSAIDFSVLYTEISPEKINAIADLIATSASKVRFFHMDKDRIDGFEYATSIKFTMHYAKLFIPDYVGSLHSPVLYLDADTIVLKDIKEIFDYELGERYTIGAVQDPLLPHISNAVVNYKSLAIPGESKYFNSGVMLINTNTWMKQNTYDNMIKMIGKHKAYIKFWEQYIFNIQFHNDWLELDSSWNAFPHKIKNIDHVGILHYAGQKPWYPRYTSAIRQNIYAHRFNACLFADVFDNYLTSITYLCPQE